MSCCGKSRMTHPTGNPGRRSVPDQHRPPAFAPPAHFKYVGRTQLIVTGSVSGKQYHFVRHGVVVAVDPRDRRSLETVPLLRRVPSD